MTNFVNIDLDDLADRGFVTPERKKSVLIAEEFRVIKRPLLANISRKTTKPIRNANLIVVTSALPLEGKSFTAVNLAMSIAMELDRHVLLVDADVARPSLPRVLRCEGQAGLLDVLADRTVPLEDVLYRTNIPNLSLLFAGTSQPDATEMLASDTMTALLAEIAERYADRVIVFDSSPLLITTESRVLVQQMGQVVFVVAAEQTLQNVMKEALATIESCPVKYLVLNQVREGATVGSGYGYGYKYS